jgi:hypothetical protein
MAGKPMIDVPLLRKMVEWVEEQAQLPESVRVWDQGAWGCGTAMCVAGKVCYDAGWTFGQYDGQIVKDGKSSYAWNEAPRLLGLTPAQAQSLFIGTIADTPALTAAAVRRVSENIAGERL